jgi:hypothetical protein
MFCLIFIFGTSASSYISLYNMYLSICFGDRVIELPDRRVRFRYRAGQLGTNLIVPAKYRSGSGTGQVSWGPIS